MINRNRSSLKSIAGADYSSRRYLSLKQELLLATAPTLTILSIMALVEVLSRQRFLFASLAVSAFLIYLDPHHGSNTARSLILSQLMAAAIGLFASFALGAGYSAAAAAMVITIVVMIVLDVVHPPAVATSLVFAFSVSSQNNLILFSLGVGAITLLVELERFALWLLVRPLMGREE
ncbi:HPP family protein [Microcoleus sp. ARI1-B5]|uniref:HPP family protein n=1 Tax=unclassified Microcoleus TaxID=2642155 RepID=UPI002FD4A3C6